MWQPIETAPRDGSDMLITNGREVVVAFFDEREEYRGFNWCAGDHFPTPWPTHWMPLPDLPQPKDR